MLKILAIVCFSLLPVQALGATCSELASQFAKDPNSISVEDLQALEMCVNQKIAEKYGMQQAPPAGVSALPEGEQMKKVPEQQGGAPLLPEGEHMPNMETQTKLPKKQ